jgi:tetratricopeptide (TPR) repeat protein
MMESPSVVAVVKALSREGRYDEALTVLDASFPERLLSAEICVLKGNLILLSLAESPFELSDAKAMYEKAVELASDCDDAVFELGMYYLSFEDDAGIALGYFHRARDVLEKRLDTVKLAIDEATEELADSGGDETNP